MSSAARSPGSLTNRYVELDALRGVAIGAVLLSHYFALYDTNFHSPVHATIGFSRGFYGVQLFFMISGFVILLTARSASRPRDFVIARATRLYPTYWVCLTISWLLVTLTDFGPLYRSPEQIAINYTMLQRMLGVRDVDGVYWSLSVELIFYGLVFVVLSWKKSISDDSVARLMIAWCTVSFGIALATWAAPSHALQLAAIATGAQYAPLFGVGMFGLLGRTRGHLGWGSAACVAAAGVITYLFSGTEAAIIVGALSLAFLFVVMKESVPLLRWRPLVFVGQISYPLYLLHQNVGYWLIDHFVDYVPRDLASVLAIPIALALAWLVHISIETRVSKQIRRALTTWLTRKVVA